MRNNQINRHGKDVKRLFEKYSMRRRVKTQSHKCVIISVGRHNIAHNRPLLVDPKRRIYVCYDENNMIQVYPFPHHASIHPPKGYFTEKASMVKGKLVVQYANRHGQKQQIAY